MQRIITQSLERLEKSRWTMLAAALVLAAVEALAQEKQTLPLQRVAEGSDQPQAVASRRIVISIPDRRLALVEDGRVVKTYSIAVGAPLSPSPAGEFKVAHRIPHPTYYAPGKVIPPGQANPLGTRWIGLNQKGYGIHGTNQPRSIGHRASHGCIRMRNRDVENLFERVRVGDVVELHGERSEELAQIFGAAEEASASGGLD